jgi:hypothetical protein
MILQKTQDQMVFMTEDRILIKSFYLLKGYNVTRLLAEIHDKNWEKSGIKKQFCFIVHCKNCHILSKKINAICAIYNFKRYCSTRSGFVEKDNNHFVVNLTLNTILKKVLKSVIICLRYGQRYGGHFLTHRVIKATLGGWAYSPATYPTAIWWHAVYNIICNRSVYFFINISTYYHCFG